MKPDAGIFHCVADTFREVCKDCPPDFNERMNQYAHVGDSVSRDYLGAINAGCGGAYLLKPSIDLSRDDTIDEEHKICKPLKSDSFTTWGWSESSDSRVPSRHIVRSLAELANRLQLYNRVVIKT